jgi:hypothetical protein
LPRRTPEQHSADSKAAAYTMWAGVADRSARLRDAHHNSPSGEIWHARRLFGQDVDLASLTPRQWKQASDARTAWLRANSIKATKARRRKAAAERAKREAERTAEIEQQEAEVAAEMARIEAEVAGDTP